VAWRGTLPEQALTAATRERFGDAITYQVLKDSHILVYPIPGPGGLGGDQGFVPPEGSRDGALAPGERLVNFVWYVNVAEGEALDELMTGRDGIRRAVSLPPGAARDEVVTVMRRAASRGLAPPIAEVVTGVAEPFVQVVYDIAVPRMAFGRVCLIGDAAFAVRPHAAAGTAKAAADGWALAARLTAAGGDVPAALARWERGQLALGQTLLARCRDIGDSSQVHGTFRPGDKRLIFGLYEPGH
jgi:2,6-dihydroxypyridine 3-monooxygenase